MAKEDFCFTYYDGDAARDKAHLDRLSRGAYDDIISAQRKFGHLTLDAIKRVLGSDFERCWPPIEWIMKIDDEGKYYIEWLTTSIKKMRAASKKQKEKVDNYWAAKNGDKNTTEEPQYILRNTKTDTVDIPLENGYGDEYKEEDKGVVGEKEETPALLIPEMLRSWKETNRDYPDDRNRDYPALQNIAKFLFDKEKLKYDPSKSDSIGQILTIWQGLSSFIISHNFFKSYSLSQIDRHIQAIIQDQKNGTKQNTGHNTDSNGGTSSNRVDALQKW